ncbi:MAG TPA: DUF2182 domain-containing protein [Bryobacteraceae bacterium]|nr:DUF2182 domain-containing protein [Bryobacteraceae bacterium]
MTGAKARWARSARGLITASSAWDAAGCCWRFLFAAGLMNLLWMAAIAAFILVEKVAPGGQWFGKIGGAALAAAGLWMITSVSR